MSRGDGHIDHAELVIPETGTDGLLRRMVALQEEGVALQRKQLEEAREARRLLHRIFVGEDAEFTTADLMAALGIGRTKLQELIEEGRLPVYRLPSEGGKGEWRIGRELFRRVVRGWTG